MDSDSKVNNRVGHQALEEEEEAAAVRSGKLDQDMCYKKILEKMRVWKFMTLFCETTDI